MSPPGSSTDAEGVRRGKCTIPGCPCDGFRNNGSISCGNTRCKHVGRKHVDLGPATPMICSARDCDCIGFDPGCGMFSTMCLNCDHPESAHPSQNPAAGYTESVGVSSTTRQSAISSAGNNSGDSISSVANSVSSVSSMMGNAFIGGQLSHAAESDQAMENSNRGNSDGTHWMMDEFSAQDLARTEMTVEQACSIVRASTSQGRANALVKSQRRQSATISKSNRGGARLNAGRPFVEAVRKLKKNMDPRPVLVEFVRLKGGNKLERVMQPIEVTLAPGCTPESVAQQIRGALTANEYTKKRMEELKVELNADHCIYKSLLCGLWLSGERVNEKKIYYWNSAFQVCTTAYRNGIDTAAAAPDSSLSDSSEDEPVPPQVSPGELFRSASRRGRFESGPRGNRPSSFGGYSTQDTNISFGASGRPRSFGGNPTQGTDVSVDSTERPVANERDDFPTSNSAEPVWDSLVVNVSDSGTENGDDSPSQFNDPQINHLMESYKISSSFMALLIEYKCRDALQIADFLNEVCGENIVRKLTYLLDFLRWFAIHRNIRRRPSAQIMLHRPAPEVTIEADVNRFYRQEILNLWNDDLGGIFTRIANSAEFIGERGIGEALYREYCDIVRVAFGYGYTFVGFPGHRVPFLSAEFEATGLYKIVGQLLGNIAANGDYALAGLSKYVVSAICTGSIEKDNMITTQIIPDSGDSLLLQQILDHGIGNTVGANAIADAADRNSDDDNASADVTDHNTVSDSSSADESDRLSTLIYEAGLVPGGVTIEGVRILPNLHATIAPFYEHIIVKKLVDFNFASRRAALDAIGDGFNEVTKIRALFEIGKRENCPNIMEPLKAFFFPSTDDIVPSREDIKRLLKVSHVRGTPDESVVELASRTFEHIVDQLSEDPKDKVSTCNFMKLVTGAKHIRLLGAPISIKVMEIFIRGLQYTACFHSVRVPAAMFRDESGMILETIPERVVTTVLYDVEFANCCTNSR